MIARFRRLYIDYNRTDKAADISDRMNMNLEIVSLLVHLSLGLLISRSTFHNLPFYQLRMVFAPQSPPGCLNDFLPPCPGSNHPTSIYVFSCSISNCLSLLDWLSSYTLERLSVGVTETRQKDRRALCKMRQKMRCMDSMVERECWSLEFSLSCA